ncbi:MAG: hemolysin III family protein [Bacteroidales bacterium]|nr:hemolysin III family protein [Bacteroidales bacterium]
MSKVRLRSERFSHSEELANTISHACGIAFGIVALVLMLVSSTNNNGTGFHYVSSAIFGSGLILVFLSSTLNHILTADTKAKDFFHNFDQIAIYILIAGTYTPISLIAINGPWGWSMFGIEWGVATLGIVAKLFLPNKFEKGVNIYVIISYLFLGWLILFYLIPCYKAIPAMGMGFIFIGGALYTTGVIFFKLENKLKFSHLIWHVFVLGGAVCHWIAIWRYVIPLEIN